jgi:peptidoglycan/LPS O-acetylase OafA/YrhL
MPNIFSLNYLPFLGLIISSIFLISLPVFKYLDGIPSLNANRVNSLDGLRGFLALGVVVNHFDATISILKTNRWESYTIFNGMLGEVGVSLFFMITGFLFWGKLLKSGGMTDWKAMYINRFFRIAPVYYLCLILVICIVAYCCDFKINSTPFKLSKSLLQWITPGFHNVPDLNGFPMNRIMGVTWTLRYEWIFYLSLLGTAVFIRKKVPLTFCVSGLILSLAYVQTEHPLNAACALFFCGMLCATIKNKINTVRLPTGLDSATAIICLVSVFLFFDSAVGTIQVMLLLVFFFIVANGCQLFGLLSLRGSHRLGNISYSLYMIHMIVLFLYYNIPQIVHESNKNEIIFWLLSLPCLFLVVIIASILYHFIEKNGIELGKKFSGKPSPAIEEKLTVVTKMKLDTHRERIQ